MFGGVLMVLVGFCFKLQDPNDNTIGPVFSGSATHTTDNLIKSPDTSVPITEGNVAPVVTLYTNQLLIGLKGRLNADASLKISALRSATALQKYKEIQNSNDPDFLLSFLLTLVLSLMSILVLLFLLVAMIKL